MTPATCPGRSTPQRATHAIWPRPPGPRVTERSLVVCVREVARLSQNLASFGRIVVTLADLLHAKVLLSFRWKFLWSPGGVTRNP